MRKYDLWFQQPKQLWYALKGIALNLALPARICLEDISSTLQEH